MTYDPYLSLRQRPDLTVVWGVEMPECGRWYDRLQTMLVRTGLSQAERRCTVTHELVHAERGDTSCDDSVHQEAARRLIPLEALAEAAVYHHEDLVALAEDLWVDLDTLRTRLDHLHPAERGYLRQRLSMKEHTA